MEFSYIIHTSADIRINTRTDLKYNNKSSRMIDKGFYFSSEKFRNKGKLLFHLIQGTSKKFQTNYNS